MNWASLPKNEEEKRRTHIYIIGKRGKTWMTEFPPKEHRHATACTLLHSSTAGSKPSAKGMCKPHHPSSISYMKAPNTVL